MINYYASPKTLLFLFFSEILPTTTIQVGTVVDSTVDWHSRPLEMVLLQGLGVP